MIVFKFFKINYAYFNNSLSATTNYYFPIFFPFFLRSKFSIKLGLIYWPNFSVKF